jgi:hypothetical protein
MKKISTVGRKKFRWSNFGGLRAERNGWTSEDIAKKEMWEKKLFELEKKHRKLNKMKLFIVNARDYNFTPEEGPNAGKTYVGKTYVAYTPKGTALKFSSTVTDHAVHEGEVEYDASRAVEVSLLTDISQKGQIKYKEKVATPEFDEDDEGGGEEV